MITKFNRYDKGGKLVSMPKFAINVRNCPDDKKMEILDYLETFGKLLFNPSPYTKEKFINRRDTQSKAWCWTVDGKDLKFWGVRLSGIYTYGWYDADRMELMIDWEKFLELGLEDSIKYMKKELEIKKWKEETDKYNL